MEFVVFPAMYLLWGAIRMAAREHVQSKWGRLAVTGAAAVGYVLSTFFVIAAFRKSRTRRVERERILRPAEPWFADHPWDPRGVSLSPWVRALLHVMPRVQGMRWWFPFAAIMVIVGVASLALLGQWTALAALVGAFVLWIAWKTWRLHGAGTCHVAFAKFPFHPGETVTLHVGFSEGGASVRHGEFSLRRIEETANGQCRTTFEIVTWRPPGELPGPNQDVEITFDVPADAGVTHLSAFPPSYWVLDIVADTSAGPYDESFLVPIYARPAVAEKSS